MERGRIGVPGSCGMGCRMRANVNICEQNGLDLDQFLSRQAARPQREHTRQFKCRPERRRPPQGRARGACNAPRNPGGPGE